MDLENYKQLKIIRYLMATPHKILCAKHWAKGIVYIISFYLTDSVKIVISSYKYGHWNWEWVNHLLKAQTFSKG